MASEARDRRVAGTAAAPTGTLIGVGVGPGDPELLTLQALHALQRADRVCAPTTGPTEPGRAENVVAPHLPTRPVERICFDMARSGDADGQAARRRSHERAAATLVGWLDAGETVAFVTLGDPNVYSTFPDVAAAVRRLRPDTPIETVAGVCAFQALAAQTNTVLTDGTESLTMVTALDGPDHLRAALADPTRAVVVYKGGRHLHAVAALLEEHGRLDGAVYGELLGLEGERVAPLKELLADLDPEAPGGRAPSYLATVIVPPAPAGAPTPTATTQAHPSPAPAHPSPAGHP